MKIDIWSDIRCPFCYIGKRKFEMALNQFEKKNAVEVEWHSFELDPEMQTQPGKSVYAYLAERKGMDLEWSKKVHDQVTHSALEVGLVYNFEKAVISNSFDAHRLIQLAKKYELADSCEEKLFEAYFTLGSDISDKKNLLKIGIEIGIDMKEVESMLSSDLFSDEVHEDELQARLIGVTGVPFFVIDNKYAISGAQPPEVFLSALKQCMSESEEENYMPETVV